MIYKDKDVCKKKLTSKAGASVALALLVFLLCALVGSTIIVAASASAGTLTENWESDQETYVLKSAGELVAKEFTGKEWTSTSANKTSGKLSDLYIAMAYDVKTNTYTKQSVDVKLSGDADATVTALITMDSSYNVHIICSQKTGIRTVNVDVPSSTSVSGGVTKVTWLVPIISVQ